jgi:tetratricopeptide (TPR) repeat protein
MWSPLLALLALLTALVHAAEETPIERARALEREQKYEEARRAYDEALREKPVAESAAADWIRLAELHFNLGCNTPDYEKTISILDTVVASYPAESLDVLRARIKLGEVYERQAEETGSRDALRRAAGIYESIVADEARFTGAGPDAECVRRTELVRFSKRRLELQRTNATQPAQSLASEALYHVQRRLEGESEEAQGIPQGAPTRCAAQTCPAVRAPAPGPPAPPQPEDTASANARARRDAAVRIGLLAAFVAGAAAIAAVMSSFFPRVRPSYGRNHPADNTNLESKGGHA